VAANPYLNFLASNDTLRIYRGKTLVFSSQKGRLFPLLDYLATERTDRTPVTVYDKVVGNAAALLCVVAHANQIYTPLGSELGTRTLEKYSIAYRLDDIVPYIKRDDGLGMCPMEELSIGKGPEEFYQLMKARARAVAV
jgi:hypothetical protein